MNALLARLVVGPAELGAVGMLLAKITLLLAAAWLVQATLGRLNPRWRVLVWRVSGSAIVLLCVLALAPPFVRLAILPGWTAESAAGAATANPATPLNDRAGLPDASARFPAAPDTMATGEGQSIRSDGIDSQARLRIAHADAAPGAPHAVGAMPEDNPVSSSDATPTVARAMPDSFWLLGLWCAGAGLSALVTFIALLRLRAIRTRASLVPDWVQCEAARVASAMGIVRGFELRQTQSLQTPCLVGILGPMILLPARQCESRHSDELPAIFAHELAHLKGADLFWNNWLNALAIGLWFHPLAWRVRLAHADACDAVCDALASDYVGDAGIYGRTLARLTLRITGAGAAPGLAMARVSSVERRIAAVRRHIFRTGLSRRRAALAVTIATTAIAVLGGLAFVPSQAEPPRAAARKAVAAKEERSPAPTQPQNPVAATASEGADEPPSAAKTSTLEKVLAAWKARQERIKSFYFAWNLHVALPKGYQFVPEGYQFPFAGGLVGVRKGDGALDAAKDVEFTAPLSEWSGDGLDRLRSDFTNFLYSGVDGWKEIRRARLTRNGILHSRLLVPAQSAEAPKIAIWRKAPFKHPSTRLDSGNLFAGPQIDLTPLRLALRPSRTASDWSPENCWVLSEDTLVGDVHCIKLQMDKVDHSERCSVDPMRDYCVVRWERRHNELAPLDVAIDVQQGPDHEWLPRRWSWRISADSGNRGASFEATVTRRMINKNLPDTTFAADYPAGTRVYDASVDLPIYDGDNPFVDRDNQPGMLPPDEARATLNAIADAWLKRQATVKRLKYTWHAEHLRDRINTLCIDGEKVMKELKTPAGAVPSPQSLEFDRVPEPGGRRTWPIHQMKTVFDGVTTRRLSFSDDPQSPGGVLDIMAGSLLLDGGFPIDHLILVFRPFDARFKDSKVAELRDPARFRVRKQKAHIGDVACVVIETEPGRGTLLSYWLDPARDYLPLREHRMEDGEDRERVDFSYRADPTCGWALAGWTHANAGPGGSMWSPRTDTIIEFTVNQPIPASDFQIDPPPNGKVQDWRIINRRSARQKSREAALDARDAKQKALAAAKEAKEKAPPKPKAKPVYDPFADATADLAAAFKLARDTNKRVLIEFGANWCPGCSVLGAVLKENAEVSAALKKDFVLVFVNTESESGRHLQEEYVPKRQRNSIPHLAVLDPAGKVLKNDDTTALEIDDDYSVPKLKAFLAQWAPSK